MLRITSLICFLLLSGCGFVQDEVLVGRYRLVAVDIDEDMSLCWSLEDGNCVGDGLPGPTLFAAGFDDKYVVAAVHPRPKFETPTNRDVTQFFYVVRGNESNAFPNHEIKGPFDEAAFEAEKARLGLPTFPRVFRGLK